MPDYAVSGEKFTFHRSSLFWLYCCHIIPVCYVHIGFIERLKM